MKKLITLKVLVISISLLISATGESQFVSVGSGGYTTQFPGVDQAGRNGFPSGTPYTIGIAAQKPVPTNDWWSAQIKNSHADNLFNYPYTLKSIPEGLVVSYIPWGVIDNILPVVVGVNGLNSSNCNVSDFSDWTVEMQWQNSNHQFNATSGIGMPFLYFEKKTNDIALVEVNQGTVTISREVLTIIDARNGADFAVYAPKGSTWLKNGNKYTSTLNGKNYWSMAFIPLDASNVSAVVNDYKKYAYVFPQNTKTDWSYNESTSTVTTNFKVITDVKEGNDSLMLLGLLPHQWSKLAPGSPTPNKNSYASIRGELKTMAGNQFSVASKYYGILPTLPYLDYYSSGFKPGDLNRKIEAIKNDQLNPWTDSYNEGQMMNRLIQTARIADLTGDKKALDKMVKTVKERLEDWLKAEAGEKAFLFYYNTTWSTLIGYPAGHGQDNNINDHHFHWGYFIHAAAFMEQYQPGWSNKWGDMINLLIADAANYKRNDPDYPFLRNFSPYAGHCWANGFASFPQGNDQESTSESMQFNSSLIHWGSITGNDTIRDLGIYLYTTEQSAIEEYWLDVHERNFKANHPYSLVSRVWGNSYDNGTFWTSDIAASYGIELYPIHGGSLYLGQDTTYADKLWKEMEQNTGVLTNQKNPNLWHDVYWEYLAFTNPKKAIQLYDSYPDRELKFGISDAQTYHWLHAMNTLGRVAKISSDHEMSAVFLDGSQKTYVAHNYGISGITVNFSDGFALQVPAKTTRTSRDIAINSVLSSDFNSAYPGGSIKLKLIPNGGTPSKVEFYHNDLLIGTSTSTPFELKVGNLASRKHAFFAKIYDGTAFNISNLLEIIVGEIKPYSGNPIAIPGVLQPSEFDFFEGGNGQNITYYDATIHNEGDARPNEYVDVKKDGTEGNTIGWISSGEWLSYTVNVQQEGLYKADIRVSSGNTSGGGPLFFVMDDDTISSLISVGHTNGWSTWKTISASKIRLKKGVQHLKIVFANGEFNLGKIEFVRTGNLPYSQPIANAGSNTLVQLPTTIGSVDGSASSDPQSGTLNYLWEQVYGPSVLSFTQPTNVTSGVTGLEEGVYLIRLTVDNGLYKDSDEMYLISSTQNNIAPRVELLHPLDKSEYTENETILISASASDLNGTITKVEFYSGNNKLGSAISYPFTYSWKGTEGNHQLSAKATDNSGTTSTSNSIEVTINKGPSLTLIHGTWKLKEEAQALAVGPEKGSNGWWGISAQDVAARNCLFNDSITFFRNGTYIHKMGSSTWLEGWQGQNPESCGKPLAPHNGGLYAYTFTGAGLTVNGVGAHLGLAKVHNDGEDGMARNNQIFYEVDIQNNVMTMDCSFPNGGGVNGRGWWRFNYIKVADLAPEIGETTINIEHKNSDFFVYPNPVRNNLTLVLGDTPSTILITNSLGTIVQDQLELAGNSTIDVSDLEVGIYFLSVYTGQERVVFKIQKL